MRIHPSRFLSCLTLGACLAPVLRSAFVDVTEEAGVSYLQLGPIGSALPISKPVTHVYTGGAAAGDFDNDGWVDLYVTRMNNTDILFRNLGPDPVDGVVRFEDVSASAGLTALENTNGAVWLDLDNDGDLDLYVSTVYETRYFLFVNNGDGTFSERGLARSADLKLELLNQPGAFHRGFGIAVGDYDRDGFLDLHTNEWEIEFASPDPINLYPNTKYFSVLLHNLGDGAPGYFEIRTKEAGVSLKGRPEGPVLAIQSAFGSNFVDLDEDGWPDLAVTADYQTSQLFWNNGNGTFTEGTQAAGVGLETSGMGSAFADYDLDGRIDWFVTAIDGNKLYRNLGNRTFSENAFQLGLSHGGWGWGTSLFDYDNDRDRDIIMTNGMDDLFEGVSGFYSHDQSILWENQGDGTFVEVSNEMGIVDDGPGKALLTFDYDNDGDLDVFIVNCQSTPILYRNDRANDNAWLRVNLHGRASNIRGVGASLRLKVSDGEDPMIHYVLGGSNHLGQHEITAQFGLGPGVTTVHELEVRWPSGKVQTISAIPANREITVVEPVSYEEWKMRHFRPAERTDPLLSAKGADPDGDGVTNFQEYAFCRNPRRADAPNPRSPGRACGFIYTESSLAARFLRPIGATEVNYRYEISTDLDGWQIVGDSASGSGTVIESDGQHDLVEIPLTPPSSGAVFLRVEAVEP